jgi:predicted RNA-binding Zn-ribbon protein involved in translation (DUF1610 family)
MIIQENDFLINDGEIFELAQHIQPERSRLAVLPGKEPAAPSGVLQDYEKMPEEIRENLDAIIRGLAYPVRLMRLHYSIADETISRQLITWPNASDEVITLASNGNIWRATKKSEFGVRVLIKEILAAGRDLRRDPFCLSLSSTSILVFLGILEQMRYARLYSTLMSQSPEVLFSPSDVLERMRQSIKEDFRWPLAMFEKVLPVRMMEKVQLEDVIEGLNELQKVELVEVCDEKGLIYELSEAGYMVADGVLHEVSKAALCMTQCRPDGIMGHDVVLLIRSPYYLFLFELAGEAGVLATLDAEGADLFLAKTMEIPDAETVSAAALMPASAPPMPAPAPRPPISPLPSVEQVDQPTAVAQYIPLPPTPVIQQPLTCTQCGKTLKTAARFCPDCGQVVSKPPPIGSRPEPSSPSPVYVCPNCGNPMRPGAKFCRSCGTTL